MTVTIVEGGELSYTLARILMLFDHKVNIIKRKNEAGMENMKRIGVNTISGAGLDTDIIAQPCVAESDAFIALMDNDLDNLEFCLYVKNNYRNKKTITRVVNPRYAEKFERVGIDIAFSSEYISLNPIGADKEKI